MARFLYIGEEEILGLKNWENQHWLEITNVSIESFEVIALDYSSIFSLDRESFYHIKNHLNRVLINGGTIIVFLTQIFNLDFNVKYLDLDIFNSNIFPSMKVKGKTFTTKAKIIDLLPFDIPYLSKMRRSQGKGTNFTVLKHEKILKSLLDKKQEFFVIYRGITSTEKGRNIVAPYSINLRAVKLTNRYKVSHEQYVSYEHAALEPWIIENGGSFPIAGQLIFPKKGRLIFLPEIQKKEELIRFVVNDIIYSSDSIIKPDWVKEYYPAEYNRITNEINKLESKLDENKESQFLIEKFGSVLYTSGKNLENIVKIILEELDFQVEESKTGETYDLKAIKGKTIFFIEVGGIKGILKKNNNKLSQTWTIAGRILQNEEYKGGKVVLILNIFKETPPRDRSKEITTKEVNELLFNANSCLLKTEDLYELWKRRSYKVNNLLAQKMKETIGIFDLEEFIKTLPAN